jgi:hypothetical protein
VAQLARLPACHIRSGPQWDSTRLEGKGMDGIERCHYRVSEEGHVVFHCIEPVWWSQHHRHCEEQFACTEVYHVRNLACTEVSHCTGYEMTEHNTKRASESKDGRENGSGIDWWSNHRQISLLCIELVTFCSSRSMYGIEHQCHQLASCVLGCL